MRRASGSIVANPVLVGAVTVLVVIVAGFLAYNANNGLPFVPTRELNIEIQSGSNLVNGNQVREGGFPVGVVESLNPPRLSAGSVGAMLKLKLDQKLGPVPQTAQFNIRPRSALGLKYVELTRGPSKVRYQGQVVTIPNYRDGATVPVRGEDPVTHQMRTNTRVQ